MAQTNIKIFNASLNNALSDNEYENSEDRRNGVLGQLARSNVHNKLFAQCSSVAKAVADSSLRAAMTLLTGIRQGWLCT